MNFMKSIPSSLKANVCIAVILGTINFGCASKSGADQSVILDNVLMTNQPITTIAFGSCNDEDKPQPLWDVIGSDNPDLWIWTGDNVYADTEDPEVFRAKYDKQLSNPDYQRFVSNLPYMTGTWDDHDYGVNDGGVEYPMKEVAKSEMYRFLNVPSDDPSIGRAGTHRAYLYGPEGKRVKVILLDTRWFRDPIERTEGENREYLPNETGTVLGEEQWAWFERELVANEAELHLIISSIQVIAAEHRFEKWANFPNELQRFYDLIEKTNPSKPVVISGDRHAGEISAISLEGLDHPFYDITSSGLTNVWSRMFDEVNSKAVTPKVIDPNYGLVEIEWPEEGSESGSPVVKISLRNEKGILHEVTL